jgi:type IV secretion system protein VirB9
MKRFLRVAACAVFGSVALASIARAEENPPAGQEDSRMRTVAYDPNQVFHLSTAMGATLVLTFGTDETVTEVAVTDSKDLKASPARNYLFFKSMAPLSLQPVIVLTTSALGELRRYVFDVTTVDTPSMANQVPDIYYSVQFTYPADVAAQARAAAIARRSAEVARAAAWHSAYELERAHDRMEAEAHDPYAGLRFPGPRNWRYTAQGSRSLTPLEVWDNGFSTLFVFPGNVRIPSIFVIDPAGREATANYAVKGNVVEVDGVARQWRLRDGNTVLCVFNQGFDAVGDDPGTGTTSPTVDRITTAPPS